MSKTLIVVLILLSLFVQQKPAKPGRIEMPLMSMEIPDILLLDQNGKQVRLYSDLVKDKIVLVHFFFTKCSDVCPMQGRALMKLKSRLGQRLGRDVFVISISRDPLNDTPEELSKWGKLFGVGPGWTLATGDLPVIKKLLWDLTGEDIGQIAHESQVLIGNDRTGVWTSTDGLLLTDELVKVIDEVSTSSLRH
jgi:cytochrome oxidase Cu insertion factor (SCO1/SenC/PrrC family)